MGTDTVLLERPWDSSPGSGGVLTASASGHRSLLLQGPQLLVLPL